MSRPQPDSTDLQRVYCFHCYCESSGKQGTWTAEFGVSPDSTPSWPP